MAYHTGIDMYDLPLRKAFSRLTQFLDAHKDKFKTDAALAGVKIK